MKYDYKLINKEYEKARIESIKETQAQEQKLTDVSIRLNNLLFGGGLNVK